MSTKLKAGTATSGAVIDADTTGILEIQTGSTPNTAITVDASQNVGIGTTPAQKLDIGGTDGTQIALRSTGTTAARIRGYVNGAESGVIGFLNGGGQYFETAGTERMRIDSSGNLLVGKATSSSSTAGIILYGQSTISGYGRIDFGKTTSGTVTGLEFANNGTPVGTITYSNTATAYNTSSDYRLKENVAPMTGALSKVAQLKPVTYTWKADGSAGQGFIAHELAEVCPDAVTGGKDSVDEDGKPVYQGIDVSFLVATLTAAIQELKAEVDALKGVK